VIHGGFTDGSVDIIRQYAGRLAYWVIEPGGGQGDTINKLLRRATGEWDAWQNSDDVIFPVAFEELAAVAAAHPEADLIIGNMMIVDAHDRELRGVCYVTPTHGALLAEAMILANQAAFSPHVHDEMGWLDESLHCSSDYEWFLRPAEQHRNVHVSRFLGGRVHDATTTSNLAGLFAGENERILDRRTTVRWKANLSRLRRMAPMAGRGDVDYVVRGLARRAHEKGGELY